MVFWRYKEFLMKGTRGYMDLGAIFDEIFDAAQNFRNEFQENFTQFDPRMGRDRDRGDREGFEGGPFGHNKGPFSRRNWAFDENVDYYPN
jgi:hypothetical protein